MNSSLRSLWLLFLFTCAFAAASAESYFGLESRYSGLVEIKPEDPLAGRTRHVTSLSPIIQGYGDWFEYDAAIALEYDSVDSDLTLSIERAQASVYPVDFLRLRAGSFLYLPGFGEITSPSSFFSPTTIDHLVTTDAGSDSADRFLFQTTVFAPFGFATVTLAGPREPTLEVGPDSPWFPDAQFPRTIPWPLPPGQKTLRSITVADAEVSPTIENTSVGLEIGASFFYLNASLLGYYGHEPISAYSSKITFPSNSNSSFDITLVPQIRKTFAAGLDLSVPIGPVLLWTDTAFFSAKTFATSRLSLDTFETEVETVPALETASGVSVELMRYGLFFLAEYRGLFAMAQPDGVLRPYLSSVITANLRFLPFYGDLTIDGLVAVSTVDGSGAAALAVAIAPNEQLTVSLNAPFFFGGADSELGQFSSYHPVRWSIELKL